MWDSRMDRLAVAIGVTTTVAIGIVVCWLIGAALSMEQAMVVLTGPAVYVFIEVLGGT